MGTEEHESEEVGGTQARQQDLKGSAECRDDPDVSGEEASGSILGTGTARVRVGRQSRQAAGAERPCPDGQGPHAGTWAGQANWEGPEAPDRSRDGALGAQPQPGHASHHFVSLVLKSEKLEGW